jgi:cyclopropane fatty-acyl-phospholipid synthase-like methyltransferase
MAKDLFSTQSDLYAKYRPVAPPELYDYIFSFVKNKNTAWDCATGNGQAANVLADHFKKVIASDISAAQLEKAVQKENIEYLLCPGESTPFAENSFDLITVSQAYHWLKWDEFKKEATRVGKPGAVIAIWTYHGSKTDDDAVNKIKEDFYNEVTDPYWEYERKFVDEKYETVDFDYELLPANTFEVRLDWRREDMLGYISTWSALRNYIKQHGHSFMPVIEERLKKVWPENEVKRVVFPVYLKLGRFIK